MCVVLILLSMYVVLLSSSKNNTWKCPSPHTPKVQALNTLFPTLCSQVGTHCPKWLDGKTMQIMLFVANSKPHHAVIYTDSSVTRSKSIPRFKAKKGARIEHGDSEAFTVTTSCLTMEVEVVKHIHRTASLQE